MAPPGLLPVRAPALADALAARGDYTDAAVWYAVFLDMFEGADPDLESMLTAVRERLMTLVEEHP